MPHRDSRSIGGLTLRVDRTLCVGFGDCVTAAPEAFALDDEGIAVILPGADALTRERLIEACCACPVDALTLTAPDGRQLAP
jgi:ferredoxin